MDYENESFAEDEVAYEEELKPPRDYSVVLINDDYTTKEFVVYVLQTIFGKSIEDAIAIMESVHKNGEGIAGTYTYDIAFSKAQETVRLAKAEEFPLQVELLEQEE